MTAIAAAVALLTIRRQPTVREIGIWVGVAAVYLMAFVRIELAEERTHLVEYGLVAALTLQALSERSTAGRGPARPALVALLITATVGTVDELIQAVLPTRVFDLRDILFNTLAGAMAVAASSAIRRSRNTRRRV